MNALQKLWYRLTNPRKTDEDEARREYALRVISTILFTLSCVIALNLSILLSFGIVQIQVVIIPISLGILWGLTWLLTDLGYVGLAGYIPLLMFFGFAAQTNYIEGRETSAILLYAKMI